MLKKFRENLNTIQFKMFLSYFLIIFIIISILGFFSYYKSAQALEDKSREYNLSVMYSMSEKMDSYINQLDQLTFLLYIPELQTLLNQLQEVDKNDYLKIHAIKSTFYQNLRYWISFLNHKNTVQSVLLINSDGSCYNEDMASINPYYDFLDTDIYKRALEGKGVKVFSIMKEEEYLKYLPPDSDNKFLLIGRKINNTVGTKDLGVIVLVVKLSNMNEVIKEMVNNENEHFVVYDNNNRIIFSSIEGNNLSDTLINALKCQSRLIKYNSNTFIINKYVSPSTGWNFVSLYPENEITRITLPLKNMVLTLIILSLVISIVISVYFSHNITKPIILLKRIAKNIHKDNFETQITINSYQEINTLVGAFNNMSTQIRDMIRQNYLLKIKEQEAQLIALQAQINPHFLYNTLNSINAYAQINKVEEISNMTHALSDILRYSIRKDNEYVKISEEISHVKNYLFIQNLRFRNSIIVTLEIDESILEYKTLPFIIQPVVENAFYHGLEIKEGNKNLHITGCRNGDTIEFEVTDNGIGISEEKLKEILEHKNSIDNTNSKRYGIGVKNVHQRIHLRFGKEYGLDISSQLGVGTKIKIVLPVLM